MPVWTGRDCTQSLEVLPLGGLHRTLQGTLIYTGGDAPLKYASVCTGKGNTLPGLEALKRGDVVKVHCLQRVWQNGAGAEITLARPAVPETVLVMNAGGQVLAHRLPAPTQLTLTAPPSTPVSITYCPLLTMRVVEMKVSTPEWGTVPEWSLKLEEV